MATVTSSQGGYATQHSQPTTSLGISASDGKDGFATKHSSKINDSDGVCIDTKTEYTHNPYDDCNECVDGIKTDAFEPRTPEGEEPVRFDFADEEEIALNPTSQQNKSSMQLELHVDFNDGSVWHMPYSLSNHILAQWIGGATLVSFIWDWGDTRFGSFRPNGIQTSFSRYNIDFSKMQQRNLDDDSIQQVKIVQVLRDSPSHA